MTVCGPWPRGQTLPQVSSSPLHQQPQNRLRVDIYFMSLNVKTITETGPGPSSFSSSLSFSCSCSFSCCSLIPPARYSTSSFISTIGGALGAWMGFSVCMIFEVGGGTKHRPVCPPFLLLLLRYFQGGGAGPRFAAQHHLPLKYRLYYCDVANIRLKSDILKIYMYNHFT